MCKVLALDIRQPPGPRRDRSVVGSQHVSASLTRVRVTLTIQCKCALIFSRLFRKDIVFLAFYLQNPEYFNVTWTLFVRVLNLDLRGRKPTQPVLVFCTIFRL